MSNIKIDFEPDPTKVGKLLTVFSAALMVVSVHGYYTMDSVENSLTQSEQQLEKSLQFVRSNDYQRLMEGLSDSRGVFQQFAILQQGFQNAESSLNTTKEARIQVENTKTDYQWLALFSIALMAAGLTMVLIDIA